MLYRRCTRDRCQEELLRRLGRAALRLRRRSELALGEAGIIDGRLPGEQVEDPAEFELLVWPKKIFEHKAGPSGGR